MATSYIDAHTEWSTSVTVRPEVRRLLAHFYFLLDIPDTSVGHRFAEEAFARDGVMFGMGPGFSGEGTFDRRGWMVAIRRRIFSHASTSALVMVTARRMVMMDGDKRKLLSSKRENPLTDADPSMYA